MAQLHRTIWTLAPLLALVMTSSCATEPSRASDPGTWVHPDAELPLPASATRLTVGRLLEYLDKGWGSTPPPVGWSDEVVKQRAQLEASMYIAGVLDAGDDGRWCIVQSRMPPYEVDAELIKRLRQMPAGQNAAHALQQAAAAHFPCKS